MLDKIQFLLSMQIIGLCVLGGIMMLLRSFGNRARLILAWSMIMLREACLYLKQRHF